MDTTKTIYELIGGAPTVRRLVDTFYSKVAVRDGLKEIFPEGLTEVAAKQYLFLTQFFGGPTLYSDKYGHPMLRARHMPFEVTPTRAKLWLACMAETLDEIGMQGDVRDFVYERLIQTAHHMVNTADQ